MIYRLPIEITLFSVRASEQGKVIGVGVQIYIIMFIQSSRLRSVTGQNPTKLMDCLFNLINYLAGQR